MADDFVLCFSEHDKPNAIKRFYDDVTARLARLSDAPPKGRCLPAAQRRDKRLAAEAPVLVALCSPAFFADLACGLEWSIFTRRAERHLRMYGRSADAALVAVNWLPALPPEGIRRPPGHIAELGTSYAELGLLGLMTTWAEGDRHRVYGKAVTLVANAIMAGVETRLPKLSESDRAGLTAAFPRAAVPAQSMAPSAEAPARTAASAAHREDPSSPSTPLPTARPATATAATIEPEGTSPLRIFISYASDQREWLRWADWHLTEMGYETESDVYDWLDGEDFVLKMSEALDRCDLMVALISKSYWESNRWTLVEAADALLKNESGRTRLVPVLIEEVELPPLYRTRMRRRLYEAADGDEAVAMLRYAVEGEPRPTEAPPHPVFGLPSTTRPTTPEDPRPEFPPTAADRTG